MKVVKVMFDPMWGSLLVLALLTTVNPVRLGIILLVLCRPRPIPSLLAYWTGCVVIGLASVVGPLLVLHAIPTSAAFIKQFADPADNPTVQKTAIGTGVALLLVAAFIGLRSIARQRSRVPVTSSHGRGSTPDEAGGGERAHQEPRSSVPSVISQLIGSAQGEGGSVIVRLFRRVRSAWQNGSPWPAFIVGVIIVPPLDGLLLVLALIVASGAAVEVQVIAAIAYIIGMLTVEEVILVSHLAAPAKTEAALRRLHDLTVTHTRKILVAFLAVAGITMIARGMGFL
ncbi:GAP family protein [Mycobacterium sp. 852002-51961_SCH5331710]|uniref:GAP family protein n=1 Tax=Mycobacterium sp. 852002-51961_SCH5331710 TaxID=1834105 RepID=UPI0018D3A8AA|nr:GAP family protein [Mycobacterium sp. 852002-51961_SCH5331710]